MRIRPIFAWYDLWVGAFIDRPKQRLYLFPLPMLGVVIDFGQEETVTEQDTYQGTDTPEADEVRRLTKVWLDERAKCPTCEGTKRLYTSSQDDEGFPCPMCQRFDGPHCTCGLSDGHPEYAHTTSCPLSSRRYTEQTTNHAPWCIGRPDHEGKCLDRLVDEAKIRHPYTPSANPSEPDCDVCGLMPEFHGRLTDD